MCFRLQRGPVAKATKVTALDAAEATRPNAAPLNAAPPHAAPPKAPPPMQVLRLLCLSPVQLLCLPVQPFLP